MQVLEAALSGVSIFAELRPDELGRIARHVEVISLAAGTEYAMPATAEDARLVIVISGRLSATLEDPTGEVNEIMLPGDRYGETLLLTGRPQALKLVARTSSSIGLIDRAGFADILAQFPAIALPFARELASELRARNDQVRQIVELLASRLKRTQIESEVRHLRRSLVLRSVGLRRSTTEGLFRRLVVSRGNEPPFWMLTGFLAGLGGARIVVHLIIKYKLENQLYALIGGADPNPMHIHHFNYGLLMVTAVGIAALSPWGRRPLRTLSFLFGLGCGLTFDEFALFWNLKPDYFQGLSLITSAFVAVVLIQLAYFRRFWLALLGLLLQRVRGQ